MTEKDQNQNASNESSADDDDLGNLSLEEKAAFEKIMAEIERNQQASCGGRGEAASADPEAPAQPGEKPVADQQELIDQIMAEIEAKNNRNAPETEALSDGNAESVPVETGAPEESGPTAGPSSNPVPQADADAGMQPAPAEDRPMPSGSAPPRLKKKSRKVPLRSFAAVLAVLAITGGYWGYRHWRSWPHPPAAVTRQGNAVPVKPVTAVTATAAPVVEPSRPAPKPAPENAGTQAAGSADRRMLQVLQADLVSARQTLQSKIDELNELKNYYQKGVDEEMDKLALALRSAHVTTFQGALKLEHVELGLHSIQRRYAYILKLEAPLKQLDAAVEDLLFQERRTQLMRYLGQNISGLPTESFSADAAAAMKAHLSDSARLSIDGIDVQVPSFEQIWQRIDKRLKSGTALGRPPASISSQDRAIAADICQGRFDRKDLLNTLDADTARCLLKWSGKDLFLNGVTRLSPEAAEILARWQGEWLSLNALQELPPPVADRLSHWAGKRLSLNGLRELSAEATASLSRWPGKQIEMIGLQHIGRWENYRTRLFLSEALKRRLESQ